jgi:hypothetical protein
VYLGGYTYANTGAWWNFKVIIASPTLVLPFDADNVHTRRPYFDWNDVPGATGYTIEASTSLAFSIKKINATVSISSYTPTLDLAANTLYYWRIKANCTNGPSAYSDVRTFTTGNPPSIPTLSAPANNSLVTTTTPLLNWNNSTLPTGTTFKWYNLQLATNNTFMAIVWDTNVASLITDSQFITPLLLNSTTYYWRVRAINTNGDFSGWSAVRSFRVPFAGPILNLPGDLSVVSSLKPTFTWFPIAGAASYNIQISKVATFSPTMVNATVMNPTYTPLLNLTAGTTYYWRVRANGAYGPGAWSTTFSFNTP